MKGSSGPLRIALYALVAIALLVGGFVLQLYYKAGEFKTLEPHFSGTCQTKGVKRPIN